MTNSTSYITEFIAGTQNFTSKDEIINYTAKMFLPSIATIFILFILLMLLLGMILIRKDRANFYAIFVFSALVMGVALFFTFIFPVIPQLIDKLLEGII